jgi:Flp pilus assembly pilin Flp
MLFFRIRFLARSPTKRRGQTMTEYALILAAVAIVAIVAYVSMGTQMTTLVNQIISCL